MPCPKAIVYTRGNLKLVDQRKLPHEVVFDEFNTAATVWHAIRDMNVRGAPAIAVAGMLAIAVEAENRTQAGEFTTSNEFLTWVLEALQSLASARPTAVNLFNAIDEFSADMKELAKDKSLSGRNLAVKFIEAAEKMYFQDLADNKAIGDFGAELIKAQSNVIGTAGVLTHCNAGALATCGWGTAVGVIRSVHQRGQLRDAYCTETRPYNQGARLTAFELVESDIPTTLICDNMVGALMAEGKLSAVVTGADRVVNDGSTANKIGTYQIAIMAKEHNIPFYIAAPSTTLDPSRQTGKEIKIEQRPADELTHVNGLRIAASRVGVWNPSFDVTPPRYITAIITELGVIHPENGRFDIKQFLETHKDNRPAPLEHDLE